MTDRRIKIGFEEMVSDRSPVYKGRLVGRLSGNTALKAVLQTTKHGSVFGSFSYRDLANLLSREDLDRILTEKRRDNRHSGVESLDDIAEYDRSLDDYHDVSIEDGPHLPDNETVEVEKNHFTKLHQAARGGPKPVAVRVALRETEDLL